MSAFITLNCSISFFLILWKQNRVIEDIRKIAYESIENENLNISLTEDDIKSKMSLPIKF